MEKDLEILLNICSVFGIYIQNPRFCNKKLTKIFDIYVILLMVNLFANCIVAVWKSNLMKEFIISWIVSTVVYIMQMCTHFIIMCEALTKRREHTDFLRLLNEIEVNFKLRLKVDIGKSKMVNDLRQIFFLYTMISKLGLIAFALNLLVHPDAGYFWWALIAIFAMRFRSIQVIIYVEILKNYMLCLNHKLNQVVSLKTEQSKQLLDIDYKHLQSLEVVKSIKHIYAAIYEASVNLNEFSQASLFAACASNFLDCTCHIYWTLLALDNYLSLFSIVSSAATIIPLALFTYKFCHTCHILKKEVHRTSLLVSRLMCNGTSLMVNKTYKNLVHDFSLQLLHQRIEITGKRFFKFDLECIFAICVLIVTHLIILIQFTKSDDSDDDFNQTYVE